MRFSKLVRFTLTVGIVLFITHSSEAQSYADNALLFSRTRPAGSARIQALGGTQVSLGGDYSSALSNPAGLGMYNHSEFALSLGTTSLATDVNYFGNSTSTTKSTFNIPGLSYVFHHETGKATGFLGGSFAITLSRINDHNSDYNYRGSNSESSIIDYFIEDAYGRDPDEMLSGGRDFYNITALAYNNYLIE
jgi:hypothetical protein